MTLLCAIAFHAGDSIPNEVVRDNKESAHERSLAIVRRWRANHRDYTSKKNREYRESHREEMREYLKNWRARNKEKHIQANREYYKNNRERILAQKKVYGIRVRDSRRKYNKVHGPAYYLKHRDERRLKNKEYFKTHPEVRILAWQRRRARMLGSKVNDANLTKILKQWRSKAKFICFYCKRRLSTKQMHLDHVVALSRGGEHSISNLCQSCHSCNEKKFNNPIQDLVVNGQLFLL